MSMVTCGPISPTVATINDMIILFCAPIGVLCFALAVMCLRVKRKRHAVACSLLGAFFLSVAVLAGYGTSILIQSLSPTT
jgi:hypothetical protein